MTVVWGGMKALRTEPTESVFSVAEDGIDGDDGAPDEAPYWSRIPSLEQTFVAMSRDGAFAQLLCAADAAIASGIYPERTSSGSSGSYFVRSPAGPIVAIFKPRDEEPYAELNPRWTKFLHKYCSPCCFGRPCLMPNGGFVGEAGASVVDRAFGLQIVPRTEIIELASPTFSAPFNMARLFWSIVTSPAHNTKNTTTVACTDTTKKLDSQGGEGAGRKKIGSFQVFVDGFEAFCNVQYKIEAAAAANRHFDAAFQAELERLVCLDYIIRNTDRTADNWLVRVLWVNGDNNEIVSTSICPPECGSNVQPVVKIAAIDHGLSFPWRHPTGLRRYPYSWEQLPWALRPFSAGIRRTMLEVLDDASRWEELCVRLQVLMESADKTARPYTVRQMSVLRGQLWNLRACLHTPSSTPADLVQMPLLEVAAAAATAADDAKMRSRGFVESSALQGETMWVKEVGREPWPLNCFSCL